MSPSNGASSGRPGQRSGSLNILAMVLIGTGGLVVGVVAGLVVGFVVGANIGGHWMTWVSLGDWHGYEATGLVGAVIGAVIGGVTGATLPLWLALRGARRRSAAPRPRRTRSA